MIAASGAEFGQVRGKEQVEMLGAQIAHIHLQGCGKAVEAIAVLVNVPRAELRPVALFPGHGAQFAFFQEFVHGAPNCNPLDGRHGGQEAPHSLDQPAGAKEALGLDVFGNRIFEGECGVGRMGIGRVPSEIGAKLCKFADGEPVALRITLRERSSSVVTPGEIAHDAFRFAERGTIGEKVAEQTATFGVVSEPVGAVARGFAVDGRLGAAVFDSDRELHGPGPFWLLVLCAFCALMTDELIFLRFCWCG